MAGLDDYTDAQLGRMLRQAESSRNSMQRAKTSALEGFCLFLDVVGLGVISSTIRFATFAYERVRSVWDGLFG